MGLRGSRFGMEFGIIVGRTIRATSGGPLGGGENVEEVQLANRRAGTKKIYEL